MSDKPEFVQVEAGEDVASVKDRLSFIRGQRVLLIWPEEGTALRRKLDLVLIQREAMRRAIRLALVTHDPVVMKHAGELNISTFETIGASERGRWKRGRSKVFTSRHQRPAHAPEPEDLMGVASRVRSTRLPLPALQRMAGRLLIAGLMIAVVLVAAYVMIPSATVRLVPARQPVQVTVDITADPDIRTRQVEGNTAVIPTRVLLAEVEDSASIDTTGTAPGDAGRARGTVVFVNSGFVAVDIPAGTQVSTEGTAPVLFRTTEPATVPAGQGTEVEVPIEAMPSSAGVQGNIGVNLINTVIGPLADAITVTNRQATFGGDNSEVRVVSQQDRDTLLSQMRGQVQYRALVEMRESVPPGQIVITETIGIVDENSPGATAFSAEVGQRADVLTLTMRVTVRALAIDEQQAQNVVFLRMSDEIARGQEIDRDSITYAMSAVTVNQEADTVAFTMTGSGVVRGQVNVGLLQQRLAGRSHAGALRYIADEIALEPGAAPQIEVVPGWFDRLPILPARIEIVVADG